MVIGQLHVCFPAILQINISLSHTWCWNSWGHTYIHGYWMKKLSRLFTLFSPKSFIPRTLIRHTYTLSTGVCVCVCEKVNFHSFCMLCKNGALRFVVVRDVPQYVITLNRFFAIWKREKEKLFFLFFFTAAHNFYFTDLCLNASGRLFHWICYCFSSSSFFLI